MTESYWQHAGRKSDVSCDVVVCGGGVTGCSTAYWLSRLDPGLSVLVVDAGSIASGASGRNAGFLLQGVRSDYLQDLEAYGEHQARRLWRFTRENRDLIFSELDGEAFDLESTGSMTVAGTEEEDRRLHESVGFMRSIGAAAMHFSAEETNRRLCSERFLGGLYVPSGSVLDPVAFVRHLADRSGAEISEHSRVRSVSRDGQGVAVTTDRCTIRAERAVLAVNAWLPALLPYLRRYIRPVRAQMYSTEAVGDRWLDVPVYSHRGCFYARQTRAGAFMVGGAHHLHEEAERGYEDAVTDAVQDDLARYVRTHFPRAASPGIERRWSGVMGFTPDRLPVIGDVPDIDGSVWAGGFSGHGMAFGFRFGRLLAELVVGRRRPSGLDLFTTDRFAETPAV